MSEGVQLNSGAILFETPQRGVVPEVGEVYLLNALKRAPLAGWRVYVQPYLNGQRPDFVLMHPERGIVVIEVKDYPLQNGSYRRENNACQMLVGQGDKRHWRTIANPVAQVESYQENILQLYSRQYDLFSQTLNEPYGVVETVLYFHNAPRTSAAEFCDHPEHTLIADRSMVDALLAGNLRPWMFDRNDNPSGLHALRKTFFKDRSRYANPVTIRNMRPDWGVEEKQVNLLQMLVDDLHTWLVPTDGSVTQSRPIAVEGDDLERSVPKVGRHRLRGVAGAGKTVILAEQAARLLMSGKRVLILTYNITLTHYIRDRVTAQLETPERQGHSRDVRQNLAVWHFHYFLKWLGTSHDLKMPEVPDGPPEEVQRILEVEWPETIRKLRKYLKLCSIEVNPECLFDAILVDEAQDFQEEWLHTALDWQASVPETYFFVTYDTAQDIYGRNSKVWLDTGTQLSFPRGGIPTINHTRRLPDAVATVAREFREKYAPDSNLPTSGLKRTAKKYRCALTWENAEWSGPQHMLQRMDSAAETFSRHHRAHPNDVVFLAAAEDIGIPIAKYFIEQKGFRATHVFDLSGQKDVHRKRNEKWRFQPNAGSLKVCTIHSIKGWEAPFIQLVIHKGMKVEDAPLIYIALSRLKLLEQGGEGALRVLNYSRAFDDMAGVFATADKAQPPLTLFDS